MNSQQHTVDAAEFALELRLAGAFCQFFGDPQQWSLRTLHRYQKQIRKCRKRCCHGSEMRAA